uniref:Uncharacterized protein n=1 Tax=Anopheles minimus TaxID=112268 RepID=A0A182VUW9_9DIPT
MDFSEEVNNRYGQIFQMHHLHNTNHRDGPSLVEKSSFYTIRLVDANKRSKSSHFKVKSVLAIENDGLPLCLCKAVRVEHAIMARCAEEIATRVAVVIAGKMMCPKC